MTSIRTYEREGGRETGEGRMTERKGAYSRGDWIHPPASSDKACESENASLPPTQTSLKNGTEQKGFPNVTFSIVLVFFP